MAYRSENGCKDLIGKKKKERVAAVYAICLSNVII